MRRDLHALREPDRRREAAAGAADDELRRYRLDLCDRLAAEKVYEHVDGSAAESVERSAHGGQGQRRRPDRDFALERDVAGRVAALEAQVVVEDVHRIVEAHDGDVFGHTQAPRLQRRQDTAGEIVVRGSDRVRRRAFREQLLDHLDGRGGIPERRRRADQGRVVR